MAPRRKKEVPLETAPWLEDPDEPDRMTEAEMDRMVEGIAKRFPELVVKQEPGKEQWPHAGESRENFLDRCMDGLMAGGMSKDKARDVCSAKWDDHKS
jgi:hypothetical protein